MVKCWGLWCGVRRRKCETAGVGTGKSPCTGKCGGGGAGGCCFGAAVMEVGELALFQL